MTLLERLREENKQLRNALVIAAPYVNGPIHGVPPPTLEAQIVARRIVNAALGVTTYEEDPEGKYGDWRDQGFAGA